MRKTSIILLLLFCTPFWVIGQSEKWEKQLAKGERNFEKGNYKVAESLFRKLIKKQLKTGEGMSTYPVNLALLAKNKEALGYAVEADTLLQKADSLWLLKQKSALDHFRLTSNLVFAKTFFLFENNIKAQQYIDDSRTVIRLLKDKKAYWKNEFDILEFLVLESNMQYNQALVLKDSILEYQRVITRRKEKVYNEKKKHYQNKNIPKNEYRKRTGRMAMLKVMEADIYRKKGNYNAADSLYNYNKKSLKLYVNKRDINFTRNAVGQAILERHKGEYKKSAKKLRKAKTKFSNRTKFTFPNNYYFQIFEEELTSHFLNGDEKNFKRGAKQYKREAINSFGKKSTHYINAQRLLIENDFLRANYKRAFKKAEKVIVALDNYYPIDHPKRELFYKQQYDISIRKNDFSYARKLSEMTLGLIQKSKGDSTPYFHLSQLDRAYFETEYANDFKVADSLYEYHFEPVIRKEFHSHNINYLRYLNSYGRMYESSDRFADAMRLYKEGAEIALGKFGELSVEYALQLERIAKVQITKGDYLKAEETLEVAVNAIKEDNATISLANVNALQTLASLYNINGKLDLAQSTLKKAYRISKKLGEENENLKVNSVEDLADVYIKKGRYDAAEDILKKSLEIKRNKYGEQHFQLIAPYSQLGTLFLIKGDFIAAEKSTRNALDIAEKALSDTSVKYLDNLVLLADVYARMGDNTKALNLYNNSIQKTQKKFGEEHIKVSDILIKKVKVMINKGDNAKEIIPVIDKAAHIVQFNIHEDHPKYAEAIELKALILSNQKKFEEALKLLEKSNAIYETTYGENHMKTADNRVLVANLYYKKRDYDNAIKFYEKAMSTYKSIFGKEHHKYVSTYSKLGQTYYAKKNFKSASKIFNSTTKTYLTYINKFFPSLSENEKAKYWNSIKGDFDIYNSLALNTYQKTPSVLDQMYNNKLATKAILLSSSIKIKERILKYGDPILVAKYELWGRKREQLSKAISMSNEELKLSGINKNKLQRDILLLEKDLSESAEGFAQNFEKKEISWKDVKSTLKPGEAAIELIRMNYFNTSFSDSVLYCALIITPTSKHPEMVIMSNGNDLEGKYYKYYRNGIKYKAKDKYSYKQFWKKIDDKLANVNTIYLSVDGVYNQLNPETFMMKDGSFLIDKYTFYNVSNTKDLAINAATERPSYKMYTATLIGNPKFKQQTEENGTASLSRGGTNKVSSVEPLPGAEKEVKELSTFLTEQKWQPQTFLLDKATESKVKDMESPRIFHVATHGFFMQKDIVNSDNLDQKDKPADNPLLKAGLLFVGADELLSENNIYQFNKKDGILTAYEAMNLNLDNTELVVLSACETGLGEVKSGEGVYGLQRSFLVAGAQNIIMTLFKVNDKVTQELMNDFYKKWLETGDKRKAFLEAKRNIKAKYDSPIYWGSFVLVGLD